MMTVFDHSRKAIILVYAACPACSDAPARAAVVTGRVSSVFGCDGEEELARPFQVRIFAVTLGGARARKQPGTGNVALSPRERTASRLPRSKLAAHLAQARPFSSHPRLPYLAPFVSTPRLTRLSKPTKSAASLPVPHLHLHPDGHHQPLSLAGPQLVDRHGGPDELPRPPSLPAIPPAHHPRPVQPTLPMGRKQCAQLPASL